MESDLPSVALARVSFAFAWAQGLRSSSAESAVSRERGVICGSR
jgi:hypothetical protein